MATKTRKASKKTTTSVAAANPPGVWLPGALALWNVRHSPDFADYRSEG